MDNELFLAVRKILNKHDPDGVMYDDENPDEYDSEVKDILAILVTTDSVEQLSEKLRLIFVKAFNEKIAGDRSRYEPIAREILSLPELKA